MMNMKRFLLLALFSIVAFGTTFATAKSKKKTNLTLVTAYTNTISEEEQTSPAMLGTFIVVKWNYSTYPETMFWRGEGGWYTCNIEKAVKTGNGKNINYSAEFVQMDQIKKGDTLLITPIVGGKFAIPSEIPQKAKNTLFFKISGNPAWMPFPVSPISKK